MADKQSELDRQLSTRDKQEKPATSATSKHPGASANAIADGLEFIFSKRQQDAWSLTSSSTGESAPWVTAYVLARLGEIRPDYISHSQRKRIEESLDWLQGIRTPEGGWSFAAAGSTYDADSTAWAITALRHHGRPVAASALELVRGCRRSNGGFAFYPEAANAGELSTASAPDVTAIAVRALGFIDTASSEFLAAHLRTDATEQPCRLASRFFVSSTLLDWEPEMAPWGLVNAVRQFTHRYSGDSAWEQALLLRCTMRLRAQTAWPLAAGLRRMQQIDGSWAGSALFAPLSTQGSPCFDDQGILATATALSALAMGDLQPGLYFGSDLPFRRL